MPDKKNVAIIGAGIAGLCCAYWLDQKGFNVQVFEGSGHVGGAIETEEKDGFLIDLGPNSTLETSEVLKELVRELGLEDQKIYGNEASNKRYIVKNGQLTPVPTSLFSFLSTPLFSWTAKLRLLKEPFLRPTTGEDVSLADFVRHRLGREFLDYAINPFVAGVYAGDPENLSTAAGFPKLYALEKKYGSLIRGTIQGARERRKRKEVAKNRARLFSFEGGMQVITDTMAEKLGDKINTNAAVSLLQPASTGYTLTVEKEGRSETHTFDQVILCVPTHACARIINPLAPQAAAKLSEVYYPPVAVVYTGFREEAIQRELDGFGFLIPEKEKREILGSIWSSTIFPGRAPEGHVAFTTFVGGTRQPDNAALADEALLQLVLKELKSLVGIEGEPVVSRIRKWPKAIPQYRVGYKEIQEVFDELENRYDGLHFAGNYRRGISVGDSVLSAHEVVERMG